MRVPMSAPRASTSTPVLPGLPPARPLFCVTDLPAEASTSPMGTLVPYGVTATEALHATAPPTGATGVGLLAPPQGQQRVEVLGHLGVGDAAHRDREEAAGVHPVRGRTGSVAPRHRLHQDVQERHGERAALVEAGDDRGVPGAAARRLDAAFVLHGAVEHLREALGNQGAGQPGRPDRTAAHRGGVRRVVERPSSATRSKQRIRPPAAHGMSPARIGSTAEMTPPRMPA